MTTPSASVSTEQYEALRQNAVARTAIFSAAPLGTILVVKTGVAGWMHQWRQRPEAVPMSSPSTRPSGQPGWEHELTLLLAQITVRQLSPSSP